MNHDPKEHFSEAQLDIVTEIFHAEINKMLVKTVGTYIFTMLLCAVSIGGAYMELDNIKESLANVSEAVHRNLPSKEYVDTQDRSIQLQLDSTNTRLDRIEDKLDIIIDRI